MVKHRLNSLLNLAVLTIVYRHHFLHAPLGVRSAKRRHQSPEWTILSHVNCFIQGEVVGFQVLLDSLHPRSTRAPRLDHSCPVLINIGVPHRQLSAAAQSMPIYTLKRLVYIDCC